MLRCSVYISTVLGGDPVEDADELLGVAPATRQPIGHQRGRQAHEEPRRAR